jgi:hypothetical protein
MAMINLVDMTNSLLSRSRLIIECWTSRLGCRVWGRVQGVGYRVKS